MVQTARDTVHIKMHITQQHSIINIDIDTLIILILIMTLPFNRQIIQLEFFKDF